MGLDARARCRSRGGAFAVSAMYLHPCDDSRDRCPLERDDCCPCLGIINPTTTGDDTAIIPQGEPAYHTLGWPYSRR